MSSTPDNHPAPKPRVIDYIEGGDLTKPEFLELMSPTGAWDDDSLEILLEFIEQSIPTRPEYVEMRYFEPLREQLFAEGKISNEQNEILKTVQKKIHATADIARVAKYTIEKFLENEANSQTHISTLHDELRRRAILFLEQQSIQRAHEEWLENFACVDPLNIPEMIKDAQEFPMPPWHVEVDEAIAARSEISMANIPSDAAEPAKQAEQAEQGEQIE
ncbi:hypothetical protein F4679DRAFT_581605 [Xylaria curta]|nr:hypothetical protein F4679DRAFT_581605 [Xylaria curta]